MAETPIAATYVNATSFTVIGDKTAELAIGVRVQANCGTDGTKYGTVSAVAYTSLTTVTLTMDSGSLTSNLTGVLHGNDNPDSTCNHAGQHMAGARDVLLPSDIGAMPADRRIDTTGPLYGGGDLWSNITIGVDAASETAAGAVELATAAETQAGSDATRAVTPAGLAAALAALPTGSSKWTALAGADYAATPASTSTLTMLTNQTANIRPGMALRYAIGGTTYYGICTAITSVLLTVAGAPLSGSVTTLAYSIFPGMVETWIIPDSGAWADAADASLAANDLLMSFRWSKPPAALVRIEAHTLTTDTGGTFPRCNARIGTTTTDRICTSNSSSGLSMAASATWYSTVVDIDTSKYSIVSGQQVELTTDANGGNDDAKNLTVNLTFVYA